MNNKVPSAATMRRTLAALEAFTGAAVQPLPLPRVPEEQLEYWGDVYVNNNLARTGVSFERFLHDIGRVRAAGLAQPVRRVRAISVPRATLDDALDLPVFLRRQAD